MTDATRRTATLFSALTIGALLAAVVMSDADAQTPAETYPCTQGYSVPSTGPERIACLYDMRKQVRQSISPLDRTIARIDAAISAELKALQAVPDPDPAPTDPPPVDPEPQPEPGPVPADPVPPPDGIGIDGAGLVPLPLGSIVTPTGAYPAYALGEVAGGKAYLIQDAREASARDVCVTAAPDGDDRPYPAAHPARAASAIVTRCPAKSPSPRPPSRSRSR